MEDRACGLCNGYHEARCPANRPGFRCPKCGNADPRRMTRCLCAHLICRGCDFCWMYDQAGRVRPMHDSAQPPAVEAPVDYFNPDTLGDF